MKTFFAPERVARTFFVLLANISFSVLLWFFIFRNLEPIFLADELLFSADILKGVPWASSLGNPIQVAILGGVANAIGDWYSAIKLFQSVVLGIGATFTFLLLNRRLSISVSALGAVVYLVSPVSLFVSSTMAEGLIYGLFPVALFLTVNFGPRPSRSSRFVIWTSLAVLSLIKPHFLVLGIAIVVVTPLFSSAEKAWPSRVRQAASDLIGFVSVRLILGFAVGGVAGLSPVGRYLDLGLTNSVFFPSAASTDFYFNLLPEAASAVSTKIDMPIGLAASSSLYFFFALLVIAPLSGMLIPSGEAQPDVSKEDKDSWFYYRAVFIGLIAGLFLLLILGFFFGGYASSLGDDHTQRVLLRYLEPYWLISAMLGLTLIPQRFSALSFVQIMSAALLVGSLVLYSLGTISGMSFGGTDTIFFAAFITEVLLILAFVLVFLWPVISGRLGIMSPNGRAAIVFLVAGGILLQSSVVVINTLTEKPTRAALITAALDYGQPLFLADSRASGAAAVMQLPGLDGTYGIAPLGVAVKGQAVIGSKGETFVALDEIPLGDGFRILEKGEGYQLAELGQMTEPEKSAELLDPSIGIISGLGSSASWGYWGYGDDVVLELERPTSGVINLEIDVTRHLLSSSGTLSIETDLGDSVVVELGQPNEFGRVQLQIPPNTTKVTFSLPSTKDRVLGGDPTLEQKFSDNFGLGIASVRIN